MTFIGYQDWADLVAHSGIDEPQPQGLMLAALLPHTAENRQWANILVLWREAADSYRLLLEQAYEPGLSLANARTYTADAMLGELLRWSLPERLAALGVKTHDTPLSQGDTAPRLAAEMLVLAGQLAAELGAEIQYVVTCASGSYDMYHKAYGPSYPSLELAAAHIQAAALHEDDQDAETDDDGPSRWSAECQWLSQSLPAHLAPYAGGQKAPPLRPSLVEAGEDNWLVMVPHRGEVSFSGAGADAMAAALFCSLPAARVRYSATYQAMHVVDEARDVALDGEVVRWTWQTHQVGRQEGQATASGPDAPGLLAAIIPGIAAARQRRDAEALADADAVANLTAFVQNYQQPS